MSSNGTTTTDRPVEDGRRRDASPTRGWIALAVLLGVYAIGALSHLDPVLIGSLLGH